VRNGLKPKSPHPAAARSSGTSSRGGRQSANHVCVLAKGGSEKIADPIFGALLPFHDRPEYRMSISSVDI
jgi:hypothetical protein